MEGSEEKIYVYVVQNGGVRLARVRHGIRDYLGDLERGERTGYSFVDGVGVSNMDIASAVLRLCNDFCDGQMSVKDLRERIGSFEGKEVSQSR